MTRRALRVLAPLALLSMSAGCRRPAPEPGQVAEKGPPPHFSLALPKSLLASLPPAQRSDVEGAIRMEKRARLYRTRALLPALEIVQDNEKAFEEAARTAGLDARTFEGLIVLECGGRDDAIDYMFLRGRGKRAHVGLGQIGWIEGRSAGLKVEPAYEARLRQEIRRSIELARRRAFGGPPPSAATVDGALLESLRQESRTIAEWRRIDERFDPAKNLRATGLLLRSRLHAYGGDPTLAVAAYHAGEGNIGRALALARGSLPATRRPTYWDLYAFRDGPAYRFMNGWSDDSRNYLPKVAAAADIVEKWLHRPDQFRDEYLYWGPDDARERLAAMPGSGIKSQSGGSAG